MVTYNGMTRDSETLREVGAEERKAKPEAFSLVDQSPAAEAFYKNPMGTGEIVWEGLGHCVGAELKCPHLP